MKNLIKNRKIHTKLWKTIDYPKKFWRNHRKSSKISRKNCGKFIKNYSFSQKFSKNYRKPSKISKKCKNFININDFSWKIVKNVIKNSKRKKLVKKWTKIFESYDFPQKFLKSHEKLFISLKSSETTMGNHQKFQENIWKNYCKITSSKIEKNIEIL